MNESFPNPAEQKERANKEFIELAEALISRNEVFPFPGIDPVAYEKLKADEEEYPGYSTPIDELLERFQKEGFKVVFSKDKASANVMLLPSESTDIENDNLVPRNLMIDDAMDDTLKKLIINSKESR